MVHRLDPSSESFLAALNRVNSRAERATREISTGYRISSASDDPDQISTLLQARSELNRTTQIGVNLGRVKTEVDTAEATVSGAVKLAERARVLGTQGANSIQTPEARAAIADELDGILRQMVGLSNTTVEGRYIFGGDADASAPYTWDETQPYPVVVNQNSAATRQVLHPSGTTFAVAHNAQQIFDAAGHGAFQSIFDLSAALRAGDQTGIETGLASVRDAGQHLNLQLAFYGSVQGQIREATDMSSSMVLRLKTQISSMQETDLTEAILELAQAKNQQQASLEARAKLPRTSLFDFLG
jgi:flagellar hook-associated protein 3 FlgL